MIEPKNPKFNSELKLKTISMFDEKTSINLKSYVYLLIDPANNEPFYVGKGKNNRVFAHINQEIEEETENLKNIS